MQILSQFGVGDVEQVALASDNVLAMAHEGAREHIDVVMVLPRHDGC
jgi:hypothetical protein